ncbi:class F sortase [Microvirga sp. 0TCS3.31]
MTHERRRLGGVRGALVRAFVVGVALAASPTTAATAQVATHHGGGCAPVTDGFQPTALSIDGVIRSARVLARGQDRHGVPRPPPLTDRGRWQLAWDRAAAVRPGDRRGVVRLTAHTYPRRGATEPPALGNLLLDRLRSGALVAVSGADSARLCYRVQRRVQVRAGASLSGYYDTTGPHRLAILVCSGARRGPGTWTHRTIWYAAPVHTPSRTPFGSAAPVR